MRSGHTGAARVAPRRPPFSLRLCFEEVELSITTRRSFGAKRQERDTTTREEQVMMHGRKPQLSSALPVSFAESLLCLALL
jgi:hypothetical protein